MSRKNPMILGKANNSFDNYNFTYLKGGLFSIMKFINEFLEKNAIIDNYIKKNFIEENENNKYIVDFIKKYLYNDKPKIRAVLALGIHQIWQPDFLKLLPFASCIELINASFLIKNYVFYNMDNKINKQSFDKNLFGGLTNKELIIAADILNSLAYEFISLSDLPSSIVCECLRTISIGAGSDGILGGHILKCVKKDITSGEKEKMVEKMATMQTATLFMSGAWVGAIISGADILDYEKIGSYAKKLGIAYHILYDADLFYKKGILSSNEDLYSLEFKDIESYAKELLEESKEIISSFGKESVFLQDLSDYILEIFES